MATHDQNAQGWTAASLLADVRRKASLPVTSTDFTDAVLLREASDVLWNFAGWALSQGGEARLLRTLERTVTSTLDAMSSPYRAASEFALPPLAVADSIENVSWRDAAGQRDCRLARIEMAEESDYDTPTNTGDPQAYALLDGRIRIYPQPTTGGKLRLSYQRRHPELILDGSPDVLTVVSSSYTVQTEVSFVVDDAAPYSPGDGVDLISPNYPYRYVVTDATVNGVTGAGSTTVRVVMSPTWLQGFPTALRMVRAGTSPYVQMPLEMRAAVNEKIAANAMRIIGDMQGMQASELAAKEELSRVMQMLSPRTKRDKPKAVNPHSHLRMGVVRGRRW